MASNNPHAESYADRTPAPYEVWGMEQIDEATIVQMDNACRLPVVARGAQMPDGHVGYGLPIGGVLATRGAVIPYAVGVDIACRMKLTVVDVPADRLEGMRDKLRNALAKETAFGMGAGFGHRGGPPLREHEVMDDPLWASLPPALAALKDKAWAQLGSSGSGNHFVEWGTVQLHDDSLGVPAGAYLALLSHSGSRGFGAQTAKFYTDIAVARRPLEPPFRHLAWLDLAGEDGQSYWNAMTLCGAYASANHAMIHRHVLRAAGFKPALTVENHHNFAWIEEHGGESFVVHRKGATPAGVGVLGVIPGTMGDKGYVVRGLGNAASLESASHGAGRKLSRKAAKATLTMSATKKYLEERGVELLGAGVDESPMAYKDIDSVMAAQRDLVETVATFQPRIVRMADDGGDEG